MEQEQQQIICLTGPMAAGKNFICSQLENESCVSIDLDKTVHQAIEFSTPEILSAFKEDAEKSGITLTDSDGKIDRRALGSLLFSRPELLARQEAIVYPAVIKLTKDFIAENSGKTVIINATVLYKTPELMELCNVVYFVTAPAIKRFFRARKRDRIPFRQILKRFNAQKTLLAEYKKTGKPVLIIKN